MIQILRLREYNVSGSDTPKKFAKGFEPQLQVGTVQEIFASDAYLKDVPEAERWNLYYTACHCKDDKRKFETQDVVPFDIDGIDVSRCGSYHDPVLGSLGLAFVQVTSVFSGNGIQYMVPLKTALVDEKVFDDLRIFYRATCDRINLALKAAGLPGNADTSVWSPARLLRLPNTLNRKPGKPERRALVLGRPATPDGVDFDLKKVSGLPQVGESEQVKIGKRNPVDQAEVMSGCSFLAHVKANPEKVDEPELYAALSIIGRFKEGRAEAEKIFEPRFGKRTHGGTAADLQAKLDQAVAASGPRTCKNIDGIWGKCAACPNYEKVTSPISLQGEGFIPTLETGFHEVRVTKDGKTVLKPSFSDLRKYFEQEHPYQMMGASGMCFVWNGKHYEEYPDAFIDLFAQDHFDPDADNHMVAEFRGRVHRRNVEKPEWFEETTHRKVNFRNGVLCLDTGIFGAHDANRGFRYVLPYDYEPGAKAPRFEAFLKEVTEGDELLADTLCEYGGYALSNDRYWAHHALVLEGNGSNGKSTFIILLQALAGEEQYSALTMAALGKDSNLQALDGKLFNLSEEAPVRAMRDTGLFKNLSSGGLVTARKLYKDPYTMRNRTKLIFTCNELPSSEMDSSDGFFRRLLIVPFRAKFTDAAGNKDPFIDDKLAAELPGVFNLMLAAYQRLRKRGKFRVEGRLKELAEEYRDEQDYTRTWIRETISVAPEGSETCLVIRDCYHEYASWAESNRLTPVNGVAFGKRLASLIPDYKARFTIAKIGGKSMRVLRLLRMESENG